jgi:hypothetical protein
MKSNSHSHFKIHVGLYQIGIKIILVILIETVRVHLSQIIQFIISNQKLKPIEEDSLSAHFLNLKQSHNNSLDK